MRRLAAFILLITATSFLSACNDDKDPDVAVEVVYDKWITHEPEGKVCADGTQYRYFVKQREHSENVLVLFEGGGACWNWETCTGSAGALGALGVDCVMRKHNDPTNTEDCVPENYADTYYPLPATLTEDMLSSVSRLIPDWVDINGRGVAIDTVLPLASAGGTRAGDKVSPMGDWNLVFVPYCTADLYAGNKHAEYVNPEDPTEKVTFLHNGLENSLAVAAELNDIFPHVPQFAMNGCSAGGAGVMATYHFFRSQMKGIQEGYVFSDAGPFFPTQPDNAHSGPLHEAVREAWDISSVFDMLIEDQPDIIAEEPEHVSDLYRVLSETYPNDRFSVAHTQTDFNYSLYSYTSFHGLSSRARNSEEAKTIYKFWEDDNLNLVDLLEGLDNFSYYMPFWRRTNDSHCISLIGINDVAQDTGDELAGLIGIIQDPVNKYYAGTEIEENDQVYTYRDHVQEVLDRENEVPNRYGMDAHHYMGLRMYCTPSYNEEGAMDPLCQCSFDEIDEDLCGCYRDKHNEGLSGSDILNSCAI